jgi:hypothetical protein
MKSVTKNPFHDLYVTETARPKEFVQLFSPNLVPHALLLFQPGNLVLKGTQGSGKSMLLTLLNPDILIAYREANVSPPIPAEMLHFVSAGINLTRSGILDIGQRPINSDQREDERSFPLFFADFLNYWVVRDICHSIQKMEEHPSIFPFLNPSRKDEFASMLASRDCWFGFLKDIVTFDALLSAIDRRIIEYRKFHLDNIAELSNAIQTTKTVIGEPISQAADAMRASLLIPHNVPLFVRIDQHEVLLNSDDLRDGVGVEYRRVINKALSTRDPRVSYRVGTRRYAWGDDLAIFGTTTSLEILRDYRIIDIDDTLRRKENTGHWVFPDFAEDIFVRRLLYAGVADSKAGTLGKIMGRSQEPKRVAIEYVGKNEWSRAVKVEPEWPSEIVRYLQHTFTDDPLSAKLAEAWFRQKSAVGRINKDVLIEVPLPWARPYWRKERARQALFQLAARCAHRPEWYGKESILGLCMGGTLIFVSLCQHIWDAFLMSQLGLSDEEQTNPIESGINSRVQAVGIYTASRYWHGKIAEQPGGASRRRFADLLGRKFYAMLMADDSMSYPGRNGFSLADEERHRYPAVDWGDLQEAAHTTKSADGKIRTKWYLNPILSPYFKLPESHVKEPFYMSVLALYEWLAEAKVDVPKPSVKESKKAKTKQLNLYPGVE